MKKLSLLLCLLLTACVRTVYVPVDLPPPLPAQSTDWPVYQLTNADKAHHGKVAKAYVQSLGLCTMQLNACYMGCEGYRHDN